MRKLILALALISLCFAVVDRKRVILVDQIGQNLIFRSNSPADPKAGTYDLELLFSYMRDEAQKHGIEFPEDFTVDAYSFLNFFEPSHRDPEIDYFSQHPEYKLTSKIIVGNFVSPNKYSKSIIKYMAKHYEKWNFDSMGKLATLMHDSLVEQGDKPKIIFFHCVAGEDRTGQVFGAYKMLFNNWSYKQALDFDNQVEDRDIRSMSRHGLTWFCYYLKYAKNVNNECEYEG